MPLPERRPKGYRSYGDEDVERLRFIRGAKRLRLKLCAIRELLAIGDNGLCPCGHTATLVKKRLVELDTEIASLKRLRGEIVGLQERLPANSVWAG